VTVTGFLGLKMVVVSVQVVVCHLTVVDVKLPLVND
jgi:hypothetical protein